MEDEYSQNDEEFKKLNKIDSEEENEEEEHENESDSEEENENITIYNKQEVQLENVIKFFFNKDILEKVKFCTKFGNQMNLDNNKNYLDEKVWRCRSKINVHDDKKNIRENSLFEEINIPLPILYFLTFYCFTEKLSIEKAFIEINDNKILFWGKTCSMKGITKVYSLIRTKIRTKMHKIWNNDLMGNNLSENGYPVFEIDESEIIGNSEIIYWMFGIIDRLTKESRVYCILNDRTANNLMKIIQNNIATNENEDMDMDEEYVTNTRIYSDCFASYQPNTFRQKGYILKRVNHSVWFGYGNFHTNNIEGLWSQIKRLTNNFSGITIGSISEKCQNDKEKKDYLDNWICYALYFREIEQKKLSRKGKISLLINYIKI